MKGYDPRVRKQNSVEPPVEERRYRSNLFSVVRTQYFYFIGGYISFGP